jgi:hypothetical protein
VHDQLSVLEVRGLAAVEGFPVLIRLGGLTVAAAVVSSCAVSVSRIAGGLTAADLVAGPENAPLATATATAEAAAAAVTGRTARRA